MDLRSVREAYSSRSEQYIGLADQRQTDDDPEKALLRRHLTGLAGPVLDIGCGPGHWTAYLYSQGAHVTGVDMVPEFIDHARASNTGPSFQVGSMTELSTSEHSLAGILAWYSTIHLPPRELDRDSPRWSVSSASFQSDRTASMPRSRPKHAEIPDSMVDALGRPLLLASRRWTSPCAYIVMPSPELAEQLSRLCHPHLHR